MANNSWEQLFRLEETAEIQQIEAAKTEIKESALKSVTKLSGEYKNAAARVNELNMNINAKIEQISSEFEKTRNDLEKFKKSTAKNQEELKKYGECANDSKIKVNEITELNNARKDVSGNSVDLLKKELMALQSELDELRSKKLGTMKEKA
ncbi:uncharacterized protein LOC116338139 [Contarinia nasturtii]|uniref:uncharacterized protein LOC116338139 n=1 Tax=Contarinia nasturtii TaxID=265458 RepID=UPI0012D48B0C|nr:uncharacterized protein LOC116338139 [Contarinia nasturtii]